MQHNYAGRIWMYSVGMPDWLHDVGGKLIPWLAHLFISHWPHFTSLIAQIRILVSCSYCAVLRPLCLGIRTCLMYHYCGFIFSPSCDFRSNGLVWLQVSNQARYSLHNLADRQRSHVISTNQKHWQLWVSHFSVSVEIGAFPSLYPRLIVEIKNSHIMEISFQSVAICDGTLPTWACGRLIIFVYCDRLKRHEQPSSSRSLVWYHVPVWIVTKICFGIDCLKCIII